MAKYNDVTMGQIEACINRIGGMDDFLKFIGGQGVIVFTILRLLDKFFEVEAQPAVTTSKEYFEKCGPIRRMSEDFQAQFLGLEVPDTPEVYVTTYELKLLADAEPIFAELEGFAGISISQFGALLGKMKGKTFVTHVQGNNGKKWEAVALWDEHKRDWQLHAEEIGVYHQCSWNPGVIIVSKHNRWA